MVLLEFIFSFDVTVLKLISYSPIPFTEFKERELANMWPFGWQKDKPAGQFCTYIPTVGLQTEMWNVSLQ